MTRLPLLVLLGLAPLDSPAPAPADLDRLHELAGSWVLVDSRGEPSDLRAEYQSAAAGAAVIETLFAGTPEETVTIYHSEGRQVTATQVSGRGAPLRFLPAASEDRQQLRLASSNDDPKPGDVTGIALTFLGPDRHRIEWTLSKRARRLELQRDTDVQALSAEVARMRTGLAELQRRLDTHLKREVELRTAGGRPLKLLETRTQPPGPGWDVTGVPFRMMLHDQSLVFATTFASDGDRGMTVAHYPFEAGPDCRVRFSILGGHAYIAVVEESKAPPRKISSIPAFSTDLLAAKYGQIVEQVVGKQHQLPRAVEWDLSRFAGKSMRLYLVDAESNHYGQIAISAVSITEEATGR